MLAAIVAYVVEQPRRALAKFLADLGLAVEYAQRIAVKAALAGFAQLVLDRQQKFLERLVIACAAFRAADAVDVDRNVL